MDSWTGQWSDTAHALELRIGLSSGETLLSIDVQDAAGLHRVKTVGPFETGRLTQTVHDYEAAPRGPWYVEAVTSTGTYQLTIDELGAALPVVHCVTDPARYAVLETILTLDTSRAWQHAIHDVIDSPTPGISPGVQRSREGTLALVCASLDAAAAIEAALAGDAAYMLRMPEHPGQPLYFVPTDTRVASITADGAHTIWQVILSWRETRRPDGPLRSLIGHTYGDDLAAYPTYRASLLAQPTYGMRK